MVHCLFIFVCYCFNRSLEGAKPYQRFLVTTALRTLKPTRSGFVNVGPMDITIRRRRRENEPGFRVVVPLLRWGGISSIETLRGYCHDRLSVKVKKHVVVIWVPLYALPDRRPNVSGPALAWVVLQCYPGQVHLVHERKRSPTCVR